MADEELKYKDDNNDYATDYSVVDLVDMDNIAPELDADMRGRLAEQCIEGWRNDKASRAHREHRMEQAMDLAMQVLKPKTFPWDDCANVNLPLITMASTQFAARAYPAIINDDSIFKCKVIGDDSGIQQVVLAEDGRPMMNPQTNQPVMQTVGEGRKQKRGARVAKHMDIQCLERDADWVEDTDKMLHILPVTGNVFRKKWWEDGNPKSTLVMPKNFIVDYYTSSLDRCPRITEEFTLYPYEVVERIMSGEFIDFEKTVADGQAKELTPDSHDEGAQVSQLEAPLLYIEQHTRVDLDDDGYPEPYTITIDVAAQEMVRMVANYEKDRIETNEEGDKIVRITPETHYTKYGFMPSPDKSFYDSGFGEMLMGLNESANSIVNRILDTGTLASASSGFLARGFRGKKGVMKVKPGEFPIVDTRGNSLRESFVQIQHPQPSPVLFNVLEMLIGMAEKLAGVQNVLPQEVNSQMAGVTLMQLVEQGLTGFKAIFKRVWKGMQHEGKIQYRLNQLNMNDREYALVMDDPNANRDVDYSGDFDIVPQADPAQVTNLEKLSDAQNLAAWKDDPYMNPIELRRRYFNGVGQDPEGLVQMPPERPDPAMELVKAEHAKNQAQIEAQMAKLQVEQLKVQLQAQKDEKDTILKAEDAANKRAKTSAEIGEIKSRTIKNIEDAEAVRAGTQYDQAVNKQEELSGEQGGVS